ncbi:hypothetical protein [Clostridium sp. K25]|uniref:hypothetical protein n=1 Tax=Clostridium sp. K25 TaxID=1443109 RepID=UPI000AC3C272|nr:hypothetical protein [Clostridium sp. K25]
MAINNNLLNKINEFPEDIKYLSKEILKGIDRDKSTSQLEEMLIAEIEELIWEE